MGVIWLVIAVLCLLAGALLLVLDRRRRRVREPVTTLPQRDPDDPEDLFTPRALPRDPGL